MAVHDGLMGEPEGAHTVVLISDTRWVVRCGAPRKLAPIRLTQGVDKVLRDAVELPLPGGVQERPSGASVGAKPVARRP